MSHYTLADALPLEVGREENEATLIAGSLDEISEALKLFEVPSHWISVWLGSRVTGAGLSMSPAQFENLRSLVVSANLAGFAFGFYVWPTRAARRNLGETPETAFHAAFLGESSSLERDMGEFIRSGVEPWGGFEDGVMDESVFRLIGSLDIVDAGHSSYIFQ